MATIDEEPEEGVELGDVEVVPVGREYVLQVVSILAGGLLGIWGANVGDRREIFQPWIIIGMIVLFGLLMFRGLSRALGEWGLEGGERVAMFFLSLPGPVMAVGGAAWGWLHMQGG